ncbi:hypothetical protein LDG_8871 [Legionella drancourtii LLAP12]|uniref:Uncharacterized protein n=1 Tax=Legionella drancourtii LLAP12 TaxID=658187 RepID=G9EU79_9GAMM|nr:hypothetical protein LDG_8871 [Legionella drancourtii LLAP12]
MSAFTIASTMPLTSNPDPIPGDDKPIMSLNLLIDAKISINK